MMHKQRVMRRVTAVFLATVLLCAGSFSAAADQKSDLESKLQELQKQEEQIKGDLAEAKSDLSASESRKGLIDSQIANVEEQLRLLNSQLSGLQSQIAESEKQIAQAEAEIAAKEASIMDTKEKLNQRLRAIMKSGNVTALQMLMNTESYTDYLLKSKAIQCIAAKDQNTIDTLEAALQEIYNQKMELENQRNSLSSQKTQVESVKSTYDSKKKDLDTLYAAAQTEVRNLQGTVSDYNKQLAETKKRIEETNAEITKLINSIASSGTYNNRMMYWPVPTVRAVSDVYGPRWGTMHRGIDIANGPIPIYGENIVAAADGTVIAANYTSRYGTGWSYGYGYSCIIDHGLDSQGRRITTLYAHCSAMNARVGQKVVGGKTVLGQAGSTGDVTGPHLHFEVRVNGVAVNPLNTYVSPNVN